MAVNLSFGEEENIPEDWQILEAVARGELTRYKPSHLDMGLRLLGNILLGLYKALSITTLIDRAATKFNEVVMFSACMNQKIASLGWSKTTSRKILGILRNILRLTELQHAFSRNIKLVLSAHVLRQEIPLVQLWKERLRTETKIKSDLSLRNTMMFFLHKCLPGLGLNLEDWPDRPVPPPTPETVEKICAGCTRKLKWFQIFLTLILQSEHQVEAELLVAAKKQEQKQKRLRTAADDGTDYHRISSENLDKIYTESQKDGVRSELMYLLMISTGMRVGALARIKIADVVTVTDNTLRTQPTGRTKEKGNKWFTFGLIPRINQLLIQWLTELRPGDAGPFVFPGQRGSGGFITTSAIREMFNRLCRQAGVHGRECHPHALRHSYAHILLENNNTPEIVSKLLNHSSVSTTQQFYLKENTLQVLNRATVPWLSGLKKHKEPLPVFLQSTTMAESVTKKRKIKKISMAKQLHDMSMFSQK